MKTKKSLIAELILISLIIFPLLFCNGNEHKVDGIINLSGKWKLIESEDNSVAEPGYDDSKAEEIGIPGHWSHIIEKNDDLATVVWLRKKIIIEKEFSDNAYMLSLGSIPFADETYVNGVCIGSTGTIPDSNDTLYYIPAWHKERKYLIAKGAMKHDRENVIAVKIFSYYVNGIKDEPELYTITSWHGRNKFGDYIPSFSSFNPFLVFIMLAGFLIVIAGISDRKSLLWYTAAIIITSLVYYCWMLDLLPVASGVTRYRILLSVWIALNFFLYMQMQSFFNVIYKKISMAYAALFILITIAVALSPTSRMLIKGCGGVIFFVNIFFNVIVVHYIFIKALINDPRRYWYLVFPTLFIDITNIHNYYFQLTHQDYRLSPMVALQMPLLIFCAMLFYLFTLKDIRKENHSLTASLLKKSGELKKISRGLPGIEVKPEPRDIIHELIDYIDTNYTEVYDRKMLAQKFGLNEFYMGQIFKKTTGTNIANYLNTKRIEAAKQLIVSTESKIIDIAFHVGFDNLTYFYRQFRKQTGLTPNEYRRSVNGNE